MVAVLTRTPAPGVGKTRLRRTVDGNLVDRLIEAFVADTVEWAGQIGDELLVAYDGPLPPALDGAHLEPQASGDLGQRISAAVDSCFTHGASEVILVGTDSPNLPDAVIEGMISDMRNHDAVLVPASDGGWIALGVSQPLGDCLTGVAWSVPTSCAETQHALELSGRSVMETQPWYDIDDNRDLRRLTDDLARNPRRAPRTAAVLAHRDSRLLAGWRTWWPAGAICAAAVASFGSIGAMRYLTYHSPAYDLGFFDQVAEQTARGNWFASTFLRYNFLGQHWEPFLLVPAALDRIAVTPLWLTALQALALGLMPLAAWRLARQWLGGRGAPAAAALAVAASPLITRGAAFDFHTEAFASLFALLAVDAASRGHRFRVMLWWALLLLLKEDAILVAAGVGWIIWCVERRRMGIVLCLAALAMFAEVTAVVMPALRGSVAGDLFVRYAYLGAKSTTIPGLMASALSHPDRLVLHMIDAHARLGLAAALLPLLLLPVVSGWALLGALPPLMIALASSDPVQQGLLLHYGLSCAPLLFICALLGWRRIITRWAGHRGIVSGLVAAGAVVSYMVLAPLPGGNAVDASSWQGYDRRPAVEALLARIPADAAVSASSGMVAHLSARPHIFEFPRVNDATADATYVVLDSQGPRSDQSLAAGYDTKAAHPESQGFHEIAAAAGVSVWTR